MTTEQDISSAQRALLTDVQPPLLPSLKILLAEDDDDMRELLSFELRRDGHDVIEASDGAEALACLNVLRRIPEELPNVVILDVRMPRRSGLEVARALLAVGWPVPIILVTAFGDRRLHDEAWSLGVTIFDKPFDMDDLRTALVNLDSLPHG